MADLKITIGVKKSKGLETLFNMSDRIGLLRSLVSDANQFEADGLMRLIQKDMASLITKEK